MVDIKNVDGVRAEIPDDAINVISGPYPFDGTPVTYVRGSFGPGAFQTAEPAASLVGRLKPAAPLVQLTRPNDTPVWVKAKAVTMIRHPLDTELVDPPNLVRSVIMVGAFHQALREDVATATKLLSSAGLNVATVAGDHPSA
jgi:hypothetical protein